MLGYGLNASAAKVLSIRSVLWQPHFDRRGRSKSVTSDVQDVLCTSKDCPIFYMRKKAQKDAAEAVNVLERCACIC